jgi:hypothetical protein
MHRVQITITPTRSISDWHGEVNSVWVDVGEVVQLDCSLVAQNTPAASPQDSKDVRVERGDGQLVEPINSVADPFDLASRRQLAEFDHVDSELASIVARHVSVLIEGNIPQSIADSGNGSNHANTLPLPVNSWQCRFYKNHYPAKTLPILVKSWL